MKLFLALILSTAALYSQSDCGNCWIVGGPQCDPLAICDFTGNCFVCMEFVDCDNHDCAYRTPWFCLCQNGASPTVACLEDQRKHTILKQKLLNRIAMRNLEREKRNQKILLLSALRTSFLR